MTRKVNWTLTDTGVCKCGSVFKRTGRAQKYCLTCKKEAGREAAHRCAVKKGKIKNPGIGSGNNQGIGKEHATYKNGIGNYTQHKKDFCERCNSKRKLVVHHKDRDRENNEPTNLETICRRCHHFEHGCQNNLPSGKALSKIKKAAMSTRKKDVATGRFI